MDFWWKADAQKPFWSRRCYRSLYSLLFYMEAIREVLTFNSYLGSTGKSQLAGSVRENCSSIEPLSRRERLHRHAHVLWTWLAWSSSRSSASHGAMLIRCAIGWGVHEPIPSFSDDSKSDVGPSNIMRAARAAQLWSRIVTTTTNLSSCPPETRPETDRSYLEVAG